MLTGGLRSAFLKLKLPSAELHQHRYCYSGANAENHKAYADKAEYSDELPERFLVGECGFHIRGHPGVQKTLNRGRVFDQV
jgi:hypothetical protein